MAQKAGADLWKEIQETSSSGWLILDEGDEVPECTFVTSHHVIEPGDTELSGKVWDKDWTKNEIKVRKKNGELAVLSLGGNKSPFLRTFIGKWRENNMTPDTLIGTKWYIKRTGQYDYDIKYLGREEDDNSSSAPKEVFEDTLKEDGSYGQIKETIASVKDDPALANGLKEAEFLTILAIKSSIPKTEISTHLTKLVIDGLIEIDDGKIKFK